MFNALTERLDRIAYRNSTELQILMRTGVRASDGFSTAEPVVAGFVRHRELFPWLAKQPGT